MCGIAGATSPEPRQLVSRVSAMIGAQEHRGPDDGGLWSDELCALGHRRLAVIDLSVAARQPLSNDSGSLRITFNGEIYNFQSLRKELETFGYRFRSNSDTEVILYAYQHWGPECLKRFRGMFAFAIWDQRKRQLFLARDRVGKKPLYYMQSGALFLFASEIQGLLAGVDELPGSDLSAIDEYLTWGYVPSPQTSFESVYKLPPAHFLIVDVSTEQPRLQVERYWSLSYQPKLQISSDEAGEAIREKLTEATRLRLISDVPVGAFLSGGIDSSIVVGLMAGLSNHRIKTFSIGFEESDYSELEYARRIARMWDADHHEFVVRPNVLEILPKLVRHFGEPFADEAALPTYYLSAMARANVTVALNGDGGDESFAGYGRCRSNVLIERIRNIPFGSALASRTRIRSLPLAGQSTAERYRRWVEYLHSETKARLYTPELAEASRSRLSAQLEVILDQSGPLDPADAMMAADVASYLPDDLLAKVDTTSMAHALEARSPFLDHEVMELAARLPAGLKLRRKESKHLLKREFQDLLPPDIRNRRKMGFAVPVGRWFRRELREFLADTLLSPRSLMRGYFRSNELNSMVGEHLDGSRNHARELWCLLMLELWQREFVDVAKAQLPSTVEPSLDVTAAAM